MSFWFDVKFTCHVCSKQPEAGFAQGVHDILHSAKLRAKESQPFELCLGCTAEAEGEGFSLGTVWNCPISPGAAGTDGKMMFLSKSPGGIRDRSLEGIITHCVMPRVHCAIPTKESPAGNDLVFQARHDFGAT